MVIVGGGPAGLTAAVNAASEGLLQRCSSERFAPGGQAGTSTRIENYPGFPFGISGDDLASRALKQAKRPGAEMWSRAGSNIDPVNLTVTLDGGDVLRSKSIFLAMGVDWRRIEIDSVDRFIGSGVYYGAARSDAGLAQGNECI